MKIHTPTPSKRTLNGVKGRVDFALPTQYDSLSHLTVLAGAENFITLDDILGGYGPQTLLQSFIVVDRSLFQSHDERSVNIAVILADTNNYQFI